MPNTAFFCFKFRTLQGNAPLRLVVDTWTKPHSSDSYIGVVASIGNSTRDEMQNWALCCRPHLGHVDAASLAEFIRELIIRLDVHLPVQYLTTDNASNVLAIAPFLDASPVDCYAHLVNLCVNDAWKNVAPIWNRLIRDPVTTLQRGSTTTQKAWRRHAEEHSATALDFITWNDTRWLGLYWSLKRFLLLTPLACCRDHLDPVCSDEDIKALAYTASVLRPLAQLTVDITQEENEALPVVLPCHFGTIYRQIFFTIWSLCSIATQIDIDSLDSDHAQPLANLVIDLLSGLEKRFFRKVSDDTKLAFALTMGSALAIGMRSYTEQDLEHFRSYTSFLDPAEFMPPETLVDAISESSSDTDSDSSEEEEDDVLNPDSTYPSSLNPCMDVDEPLKHNSGVIKSMALTSSVRLTEEAETPSSASQSSNRPNSTGHTPDTRSPYKGSKIPSTVPLRRSTRKSKAPLRTLIPKSSSTRDKDDQQDVLASSGGSVSSQRENRVESSKPSNTSQSSANPSSAASLGDTKGDMPQSTSQPTPGKSTGKSKSFVIPRPVQSTLSLRIWIRRFVERYFLIWDQWCDEEAQNRLIYAKMNLTAPASPEPTSDLYPTLQESNLNFILGPVASDFLKQVRSSTRQSNAIVEVRTFRQQQHQSLIGETCSSALQWCDLAASTLTPEIRKIIVSLHSIPVSTVSVESLFSSAKLYSDPLASKLRDEDFESLVLVHYNSRNFRDLEILHPIGLAHYHWSQMEINQYVQQLESDTGKNLRITNRNNTLPATEKKKEVARARRSSMLDAVASPPEIDRPVSPSAKFRKKASPEEQKAKKAKKASQLFPAPLAVQSAEPLPSTSSWRTAAVFKLNELIRQIQDHPEQLRNAIQQAIKMESNLNFLRSVLAALPDKAVPLAIEKAILRLEAEETVPTMTARLMEFVHRFYEESRLSPPVELSDDTQDFSYPHTSQKTDEARPVQMRWKQLAVPPELLQYAAKQKNRVSPLTTALFEHLTVNKMTLVNVPGDGNCFFHALIRCLADHPNTTEFQDHIQLRQDLVAVMAAWDPHSDFPYLGTSLPPIALDAQMNDAQKLERYTLLRHNAQEAKDAYLKALAIPGTWDGSNCCKAFTELHHFRIRVWIPSGHADWPEKTASNFPTRADAPRLDIAFFNNNHFVAVVNMPKEGR